MASNKNESNEAQRILTPEFRVSYPHVFKPNAIKGSAPKYSVTMLFPKSADLSSIKLAMKHAKIAEFGPDKANWPAEMMSPVTDGDLPKYAQKEGYKGQWAIKATSNEISKPDVVDFPNANPIINPGDFYPGCYARAQVFARVWEFPEGSGRYGTHFILDCVQKTKDGKSFSSKKSAKDVFNPGGAVNDDMNDSDGDDEDFT